MKKNWIPVALFLSIIIVVFTYEFAPQKLPTAATSDVKPERFPVFFIEGIEALQFDDAGHLAYQFNASEAKHFQSNPKKPSPDDFTEIQEPGFNFFKGDAQPWHLTALRGTSTQNGEKLALDDNVTAWQKLVEGETRIDTQQLTLYPAQQFAESDKAVIITYPRTVYRGEGLEVDFKQQVFTLLANVKGTHTPPFRNPLKQTVPANTQSN